MAELFTLPNLFTLLMLILLQAVLGFDNLLYISIESSRVEESKQQMVRRLGIGIAIALRLILLVVVVQLIQSLQEPFFSIHAGSFIDGEFNFQSVVSILGGGFIMYTALKEIMHLLAVEHIEHTEGHATKSVFGAIAMIVTMNLIFSFDSLLSAIALTDVVPVMATAIIISGIMMIVLADGVSAFLKANRNFEVIGLFTLFIVGILLITEGGHLAHLKLFGYPVDAMSKSSFYFVIFVMVIVSVVQSRYRTKLDRQRKRELKVPDAQNPAATRAH